MKKTLKIRSLLVLVVLVMSTLLSTISVSAATCTSHTYKLTKTTSTAKTYTCSKCGATKSVKVTTKTTTTYNDKTYTVTLKNGKKAKVTGHYDTTMANEIVKQLNAYRKQKGKGTLKTTKSALKSCANLRAYEISYKFSHTRPNGKSCFTANKALYGENIASGYKTADSVMKAWKKSSGHNKNMLDKSYKYVYVSVFAKKCTTKAGAVYYTYYAVQNFGK